jgi:hypothetical protein
MRSSSATHNLLAISANLAETAINTPQILDTALICSMDNILKLDPRRETDAEEANGREEAGRVYNLGNTSSVSLLFDKMMAQHAAMFLAYGLGSCTSIVQGSGYLHTITPRQDPFDYDRDQLAFTAGQRLGGVTKRQFASLFVDSVDITYAIDQFAKLSASIKGTGKFESNLVEEVVSAAGSSTTITLAVNAMHGATAEERLDSVHQVFVELAAGIKTEVTVTAVSATTPAELTIEDPGGDVTLVNFTVIYVPTEAAWASFPATIEESPLLVCGLTVVVGGTWNGATFEGGRNISSEITGITYSLQNGLNVSFAPGGCTSHANKCTRPAREQVVKLDREMRDYIMQLHLEKNEYIGIELDLIGDEYAPGENYQVKTVIPRLGVLNNPLSVKDKKLAEAGDLLVLDDGNYPSIIHTVRNQVSGYAQ